LNTRHSALPAARTAGFTLIEVLLTIAVLSVGLLGLAAMQVIGLKSSSNASFRSQATLVAADMVERIRLNPGAINRFQLLTNGTDPFTDCETLPPFCSTHLDNGDVVQSIVCNPQQMADFDINMVFCGQIKKAATPGDRWGTGVNGLPGGQMTVVCSTAPNCDIGNPAYVPEYVVSVTWQEQVRAADGSSVAAAQSVAIPFVPWGAL
jgi:type IV pilus modification protein PilV